MSGKNGKLQAGTARITPQGILFRDSYYTCRLALRCGWYAQAMASGPWEIRVLHNAAEEQPEAVYIDSEDFEEERVCLLIDLPLAPSEAAEYQARLRKLADERRLLYGNKPVF